MRRIAVIGAGVIGASVAFRLVQGGARVWVIDKSQPANGTTSASFAWANAYGKSPYDYFELNYAGLKEHFRLRDELAGKAPWLHLGGNLAWTEDEGALAELRRRVDRMRSWGYAAEWWKAWRVNEVLESNVALPSPDTPVAFFPEEAWVDAPQLTKTLIELVRRDGGQTCLGTAVETIETRDGRVVAVRLAGGDRLSVDAVVNAAGAGADMLAAQLGRSLPLASSKGLLVRLALKGETPLGRILHPQQVNIRPDGPRRVLVHHESIDEKLERGTRVEKSLCSELLERAQQVVPALKSAEVAGFQVGVRFTPKDGRSCVGAVPALPGYYEAVTHSGVTLGPLVGRLLAREVLTGEVDSLIAPFRPARFTGG